MEIEYKKILHAAPDLYLIVLPNKPFFTIVEASDAYLKATLTIRENVIGRGLFEIFPDNPDDLGANATKNLRYSLEWVIDHKAPHKMEIQKYDIPEREHHGQNTSVFVEKYWSPLNSPVLLNGEIVHIIHRVEDVTELIQLQKQHQVQRSLNKELQTKTEQMAKEICANQVIQEKLQQAYEDSDRMYWFLAEAIPQFVWTAENDGTLTYYNKQWFEYTGTSKDQMNGKMWEPPLIHERDFEENLNHWRASLESGDTYAMECRLRRADGVYKWFLCRAVPMRDSDHKIIKWFGTSTDIDDQKRLESVTRAQELQKQLAIQAEAENFKKKQIAFIDTVHTNKIHFNSCRYATRFEILYLESMETRTHSYISASFTPLSEFLQEDILALEKVLSSNMPLEEFKKSVHQQLLQLKTYVHAITDCVKHQKMITDDVLDLSRLEANKFELCLSPINLRLIIESCASMFNTHMITKHLQLKLNFPEQDIIGDSDRLSQILINIISNAIKFTRQGGITISLSYTPSVESTTLVRISVEDTGIGMSKMEQAKLFDRFSQANKMVSREYGGSGLGLAISKSLVELMGGHIEVQSKKYKGSKFSIVLNVEICKHHHLQQEKQESIITKATVPRKILVVEDNSINQNILARFIHSFGHDYKVANDGEEALACLEDDNFDIIFMDVEMPGIDEVHFLVLGMIVMDGLEATRRIRQKEKAREIKKPIPIIGLSGNARAEQIHTALDAGMVTHLIPVDFSRVTI